MKLKIGRLPIKTGGLACLQVDVDEGKLSQILINLT